jgi:hypothetical protein
VEQHPQDSAFRRALEQTRRPFYELTTTMGMWAAGSKSLHKALGRRSDARRYLRMHPQSVTDRQAVFPTLYVQMCSVQ